MFTTIATTWRFHAGWRFGCSSGRHSGDPSSLGPGSKLLVLEAVRAPHPKSAVVAAVALPDVVR